MNTTIKELEKLAIEHGAFIKRLSQIQEIYADEITFAHNELKSFAQALLSQDNARTELSQGEPVGIVAKLPSGTISVGFYLNVAEKIKHNDLLYLAPPSIEALQKDKAELIEQLQSYKADAERGKIAIQALRNIIDGNYPMAERPSQCKHDKYWYEACEQCIEDYINAQLEAIDQAMKEGKL